MCARLCRFLGNLLLLMACVKTDAQPASNLMRLAPPPLMLPTQPANSLQNTVTTQTGTNTVPKDPLEITLIRSIDDTKRELDQTNLNPTYRKSLEHILIMSQEQLSNHEAQVQDNSAYIQSIQEDPKSSITNKPDPLVQAMASIINRYQAELTDTNLDPYRRKADIMILADYQEKLADHMTNIALWNNVTAAQSKNDSKGEAKAQQQLADYLSIKLGQMQGKTYPKGMSLDAVMEQYRIQLGGSRFDPRKIIIGALILVTLLPLLFLCYKMARRHKN